MRSRCIQFPPVKLPDEGDIGLGYTDLSRLNRGIQYHCGVYYRNASGELRFLNLAWHLDLRSDNISDAFGWLTPPLEEEQQIAISQACELVILENGTKLPYAIAWRAGFNAKGTMSRMEAGDGFTCATFVLAIFHMIGVSLVNASTWPPSGNPAWHEFIISTIERVAASRGLDVQEHLAAMRDDIGCTRIEPHQVAAACCFDQLPVTYADIVSLADGIADCLREHLPSL